MNATVLRAFDSLRGGFEALGLRIPGKGRPVLRIVISALVVSPAVLYLWLLFLPWPVDLVWRNPSRTSFMEYRLQEAKRDGDTLHLEQTWVPLEEVSPNLRRAVLAAEDDRFYQHRGIDWRSLGEEVRYRGDTAFSWWNAEDLRALKASVAYAWANRKEIKGRSTLTQQLAKNLYFTPRRSLSRKFGEFIVAKRLEACLSKDRILELYLNLAEWGPGLFGAQAAAEAYFRRDAQDLTMTQAAALAATLPHPLSSNPSYRPGQMEWRRDLLLSRLRGPPPPSEVEVPLPVDTSGPGPNAKMKP